MIAPAMSPGLSRVYAWFASRGWEPHAFQLEAWRAYLDGVSGLVHAPTGTGKTHAVFLGPVIESIDRGEENDTSAMTRVLWITPLRALATDTTESLRGALKGLGSKWTVEKRTGDTSATIRKKIKETPPNVLVTTPESVSLMLTHPQNRERLAGLRCVVVDEWHELLSTKRGVQTELALARLRRWAPELRTWGLSATLANKEQARDVLIGAGRAGVLVGGSNPKSIVVDTLVPSAEKLERFPWAGHLGLTLLDEVVAQLENARTTLLFTNTRSQAELWFRGLTRARPDWLGQIAIHHGSLDRAIRDAVEDHLRAGTIKCVVCTSSLDLGVDFSPVDQVLQVGSPKGIARLMQRAGRSGHQPGAVSRVIGVPTHAMELVEFAAARDAVEKRDIEARTPIEKPLDVLAQHLVTIALGGGFYPDALLAEVRTTSAYRTLTNTEWHWVLDFVVRGGSALRAYPQYARVRDDGTGLHVVADQKVARLHRMSIGTITSESAMRVAWMTGGTLGTIEESFIAKLHPGDRFVFAGRTLELVRVREMTAFVRRSTRKSAVVPVWEGGKMPLSTQLSSAIRRGIDRAREGVYDSPEMTVVRPMLELQARWSRLPGPDELLIETTSTRDGRHLFIFPFEGRLVHEGLGALLAHRLAAQQPRTLTATANDYGVELLIADELSLAEDEWRQLLSTEDLLPDLLRALNSDELARRRFRDVARVAGLVFQGYPGAGKTAKQLQASSELFFDVFRDFDPANLLLDQARREVMDEQLEVSRLRGALEQLAKMKLVVVECEQLTPLAFPLWAERLRTQHVTSETWADRVRSMAMELEEYAQGGDDGDAEAARRSRRPVTAVKGRRPSAGRRSRR